MGVKQSHVGAQGIACISCLAMSPSSGRVPFFTAPRFSEEMIFLVKILIFIKNMIYFCAQRYPIKIFDYENSPS